MSRTDQDRDSDNGGSRVDPAHACRIRRCHDGYKKGLKDDCLNAGLIAIVAALLIGTNADGLYRDAMSVAVSQQYQAAANSSLEAAPTRLQIVAHR